MLLVLVGLLLLLMSMALVWWGSGVVGVLLVGMMFVWVSLVLEMGRYVGSLSMLLRDEVLVLVVSMVRVSEQSNMLRCGCYLLSDVCALVLTLKMRKGLWDTLFAFLLVVGVGASVEVLSALLVLILMELLGKSDVLM